VIKTKTYFIFLPFVILYFFLNNFLLPQGLLYTAILTPLFLYWLYKNHQIPGLLKWGILLLIPIPFQILSGVDIKSYGISTVQVFTVWIFLFTAIKAVKFMQDGFSDILRQVLAINTLLVFLALLILPFPTINSLMWDFTPISPGVPEFPRLMLLAYEPSHYALLLSPVFIYFLLKIMMGKSDHPLLLAFAVIAPLIISLSFGVLGALVLALLITAIAYFLKFPASSRSVFFNVLILFVIAIVILAFVWPSNPVFERLGNIFQGSDTSAKGRLSDSFMFAVDLIKKYNPFFGVGPGQVKVLAHDFIVEYYQYYGDFAKTVRIPNSMGEMLAVYGVYGFVLKLAFEIFFFVRLKIYQNIYSFALFLFIFIYQFTGSFLTNVAEMGIWAIVFGIRFQMFELNQRNIKTL
jgi:O-antigen ligase